VLAATSILTGQEQRLQAAVALAPRAQSNRKHKLPQFAVLKIHPVMALHVVQ
jgi:hypothetical protein